MEKLIKEMDIISGRNKAKTGKLPTLSDELYLPPNKDGSRKSCKTCAMWSEDMSCMLHNKDIEIKSNAVCGYYVNGIPQKERIYLAGLTELTPELSGLIKTDTGTSCNNCSFFEGPSTCSGTRDGVHFSIVDPLGCCARWDG